MREDTQAGGDALEPLLPELETRIEEIADRFLEELESGRRPDCAAIIAAHSDLGADLGERLLAVQAMYGLSLQSGSARSSAPCVAPGTFAREPGLKSFGRFEVIEVIGRGSFGEVYKARDVELDRIVAIKVPRLGGFATGQDEERFLREARNAARLRHPGIVQVHDAGRENEVPYIVSDFIEGETLANLIERSPPTFREAALMVAKIAGALEYAHTQGVVHRDIKPGNILIDLAGEPHIADLGLARRVEGDATVTLAGEVLGTPAYMAPEQAAGEVELVEPRSDIYSLGVVLYEVLTGERPFRGSRSRVLEQVLKDEPQSPRCLKDRIPRDLETICLKAMAKDPSRRYQNARELAADLHRFIRGEPIRARPVGPAESLWRWSRRNPVVAGLSGAVALLLLTVTVTSTAMAIRLKLARDEAATNATREKAARLDTDKALERAEGLRLAAESSGAVRSDPGHALLLAIEGARRAPGRLANNALLQALASLREEHTLRGYSGAVSMGAFSPDGGRLFTASWDGVLRIWDASSGEELLRLHGPCQAVHWAQWSPDGTKIASGCFEPVVRLWDAASGKQLFTLHAQEGTIDHVAFSPDGRTVASAGSNGKPCLWSVETGKLVVTLAGHEDRVLRVEHSPDGSRLATASQDGTARVWDAGSGRALQVLRGHTGGVDSVAFDPNGGRVVTASQDGTARIWDAATGRELAVIEGHRGRVLAGAFSPDGQHVLTASGDGTARIWSAATGEEIVVLRGHEDQVNSACFSPDGRRVLTASDDHTARLWDASGGAEMAVLRGHRAYVRWAAFSPDGLRAITTSWDYTARVWNVSTESEEAALKPHRDWGPAAVLSPNLKQAVVLAGKTASLHDTTAGQEIARLHGHQSAVTAADFSEDSRWIATASLDGTARVWDSATGQVVSVLRGHTAWVRSARFSPDGSKVATAAYDLTAGVWDTGTGKRILTLRNNGWVEDARFSPDGSLIVTASADSTARIWDAATGAHVRTLGHNMWLSAAIFSSEGSRLLTASPARILVWDVSTGARVASLAGYEGNFLRATFSSDGVRVATVHTDGTARLWDLTNGKETATLRARRGLFVAVRFTNDGQSVATVEEDGITRIWPLDPLPNALARRPRPFNPEERARADIGSPEERADAKVQYAAADVQRTVRLARRQTESDPSRDEARFRHALDLSVRAEIISQSLQGRGLAAATARDGLDARIALGEAARFLEETVELAGASAELKTALAAVRTASLPDLASYGAADAALDGLDRAVLVPEGANWKYFPGTKEPSEGLEWTAPDFVDQAGGEGASPFGRTQGGTPIQAGPAAPLTLYLRHRLRLDDPGRYRRFLFSGSGEDAFVVYVNGVEVLRSNAGKAGVRLAFNHAETDDAHEKQFELPLGPDLFRRGDNVLAVQALRAATGPALVLHAVLVGESVPKPERDDEVLAGLQRFAGGEAGGLVLLYLEARLLARRGRHGEAAARFADLHARDPAAVLPLVRLVESLRALGKDADAAARLKEGLARLPDPPSVDSDRLGSAAWDIVTYPSWPLATYARAYLWSRRARAIEATNVQALTRMGVALYRLELHAEALETLRAVSALRAQSRGGARHRDLAFIAMALARLGRAAEAQATLAELREWLKAGSWNRSPYVLEAERVVAGVGR